MAVATVQSKTGEPAHAPAVPRTTARKAKTGNGAERATGSASSGIPADVDFWDWLTTFSTNEWQNLIGYLWRVSPIHDARFGGKPTHVRKYAARFDLERIKLDEGSGGYRIDFCQTDPATTIQKRIAQHYFQILDMDFPPRMPYGDWIKYPENSMWLWAEAALKKRAADAAAAAADQPASAAGATGAYNPAAIYDTVFNGIRLLRGEQSDNSELASTVLQMVQSSQAQMMALNDPVKQLETLQTLLAAIKPNDNAGVAAAAAAAASNNLVVDVLREDLRETRKELREMRAAREAQATAPARSFVETLLDDIPKLQQVASALGFSRRGGDAGTDLGSVAVQVIDKLADHVPAAIELWRASKETPGTIGAGAGNWAALRRPAATQPAAATTTATAPAADATAAGTEEPTLPEEERKRLTAILMKFGKLIEAVAPFLVDQYRAGLTGYDFRDWFKSRHGALSWAALKTEVGAEQLVALAQQHPHLKAALAPPEKLLEFLRDFFTEEGEERTAEPEPGQPE